MKLKYINGAFTKGMAQGEIEVTDPGLFERYREEVLPVVTKYGGRFIVRGGRVEPLEGGWTPQRMVALAFPSMEHARRWFRSPEYAGLVPLRRQGSRVKLVLLEGL